MRLQATGFCPLDCPAIYPTTATGDNTYMRWEAIYEFDDVGFVCTLTRTDDSDFYDFFDFSFPMR